MAERFVAVFPSYITLEGCNVFGSCGYSGFFPTVYLQGDKGEAGAAGRDVS